MLVAEQGTAGGEEAILNSKREAYRISVNSNESSAHME